MGWVLLHVGPLRASTGAGRGRIILWPGHLRPPAFARLLVPAGCALRWQRSSPDAIGAAAVLWAVQMCGGVRGVLHSCDVAGHRVWTPWYRLPLLSGLCLRALNAPCCHLRRCPPLVSLARFNYHWPRNAVVSSEGQSRQARLPSPHSRLPAPTLPIAWEQLGRRLPCKASPSAPHRPLPSPRERCCRQ